VITLSTCQASIDVLKTQLYKIEWHEYAMAHSVNNQEIDDIRNFLQAVL
jgi:phospholipase/carboxylesterase